MADDDLVTIAKYGSPQDAQLTKSVLEGQGIRACVVDDATTGWLWYLGTALGGAKLQVAQRDVEKANDARAGYSGERWIVRRATVGLPALRRGRGRRI